MDGTLVCPLQSSPQPLKQICLLCVIYFTNSCIRIQGGLFLWEKMGVYKMSYNPTSVIATDLKAGRDAACFPRTACYGCLST